MSAPFLSEWPPLPPSIYLRRPRAELPYPLGEPNCRLYGWGRTALWHGLQSAALSPGDEVLVPAYHHGAEIGVLRKARLLCRYYEATEELSPDTSELDTMLGPRVRALYLIHYLGFPQDVPRWRRWCDEHGLLLIEDVAMAWLAGWNGRPLGSWGDIAFFSPWKMWGLPDLGALLSRTPPAQLPASRRVPLGMLARGHVKWLAQRWGWIGVVGSRITREGAFDPEYEFDLWDPDWPPSATSIFLLRRFLGGDPARARRENYQVLLDALGENVPPAFSTLPAEACPFAFPIHTDRKRDLLRALEQENVQGINLWAVPHPSFATADFPVAARMRATTVALPVHQELRHADLERMIRVVQTFLGEGAKAHAATTREETGVTEGDQAPDFELSDQHGNPVRLSSFAGQTVVLYFYPEADTTGCTAQACALRDREVDFGAAGAVVLGVSPDKPEKLARFAGKYGLPFTLLADERHEVAERYGVWVKGGARFGILPRWENERTTFIIGPDGVIQRILRNVDPRGHDALVLRELTAP